LGDINGVMQSMLATGKITKSRGWDSFRVQSSIFTGITERTSLMVWVSAFGNKMAISMRVNGKTDKEQALAVLLGRKNSASMSGSSTRT